MLSTEMYSVFLLMVLYAITPVNGMIIRTQPNSSPEFDPDLTDLVNGSLFINIHTPDNTQLQNSTDTNFTKKHSTFVGFTAWKQTTQDYNSGEVITFEDLSVNEGGHYQPSRSRFIVPVDGIYYIAFTFRVVNDAFLYIENENQDLYTYNNDSHIPDDISSNSFIVHCLQGDVISVRGGFGPGTVYGEEGVPHSTFTVFLMDGQGAANSQHYEFNGFSAWLGSNNFYGPGDVITFDRVWLNEGRHYFPALGQFRCPFTGRYWVSVHFMQYLNYPLNLGVDKSTITVLQSQVSSTNVQKGVSNMGLFECEEGETFSVKGLGDGGIIHGGCSTFSAMLMHETGLRESKQYSTVGFTAWKKYTQNYTDDSVIDFEGVMVNEGDGYQPNLGRFQCPVDGIYFVALTCKKEGTSNLAVNVLIRSTSISLALHDATTFPDNTVTNSGLVRCFTGETISVFGVGSGRVYGHPSEPHSTFSAMLLYEYESYNRL